MKCYKLKLLNVFATALKQHQTKHYIHYSLSTTWIRTALWET